MHKVLHSIKTFSIKVVGLADKTPFVYAFLLVTDNRILSGRILLRHLNHQAHPLVMGEESTNKSLSFAPMFKIE